MFDALITNSVVVSEAIAPDLLTKVHDTCAILVAPSLVNYVNRKKESKELSSQALQLPLSASLSLYQSLCRLRDECNLWLANSYLTMLSPLSPYFSLLSSSVTTNDPNDIDTATCVATVTLHSLIKYIRKQSKSSDDITSGLLSLKRAVMISSIQRAQQIHRFLTANIIKPGASFAAVKNQYRDTKRSNATSDKNDNDNDESSMIEGEDLPIHDTKVEMSGKAKKKNRRDSEAVAIDTSNDEPDSSAVAYAEAKEQELLSEVRELTEYILAGVDQCACNVNEDHNDYVWDASSPFTSVHSYYVGHWQLVTQHIPLLSHYATREVSIRCSISVSAIFYLVILHIMLIDNRVYRHS
jgi:hypothetical protein